jgi:hypothetical protein
MKNNNKKNEYKTLLSALAYGAPEEAQKLVIKYGEEKATDHDDLEYKLAKIYSSHPHKIEVEKDFASIHPHSKFILKYSKPLREDKPLQPMTESVVPTSEGDKIVKNVVIHDGYENADGESNHQPCNCKCCNPKSNADGLPTSDEIKKNNFDYLVLFGIIAIVGMVAISKNKI